MSPQETARNDAMFSFMDTQPAISLAGAVNLVEQLGFTKLPINGECYGDDSDVIHLIVHNRDQENLLGAFVLKPKKIIPIREYPLPRQNPLDINVAQSETPVEVESKQDKISELIGADSPALEPSVPFEKAKKILEDRGCQQLPFTMAFYAGLEGRVHAFVSSLENPDILIGVFKLDFSKIIPPDTFSKIDSQEAQESAEEKSPYDDGFYP